MDAPCTGTGTLRRNPDLKWRLTPQELDRINAVQKSVLEEAAKLLKPDGRLVYATCSVLQRENQDVVKTFLESHPEFELLNATDVLAKQPDSRCNREPPSGAEQGTGTDVCNTVTASFL